MKVPDEKLYLSGQGLPTNDDGFLDNYHKEKIILLAYRALQDGWKQKNSQDNRL